MKGAGAALSGFRGALPFALGICTFSTIALAAGDPETGEVQFQLGARDEAVGDYARALEHYRTSLKALGSGRLARNARNRIVWIEERSQGGLAPLAALARLRREPSVLDDPAASARLAAEAESFPPGSVRSEIRLRIAQAWLRQPLRRAEALGELRKIVSDPSAGGADAVLAERGLVGALLAAGQLEAAQEEVLAHPFDPTVAASVERRLHRRFLRRTVEAALIVLLAAFAVVAFAHRRRAGGAALPPASGAQIQAHEDKRFCAASPASLRGNDEAPLAAIHPGTILKAQEATKNR